MISIIKQGHLKIMKLFYTDKHAKLHLREMARRAKLHGPSATAFLKALEKDGILTSEKDGNQKKYSLRMNNKTYFIFELFDLEKINLLPSIRKSAIDYFIGSLKEKPLIAVVFGSTAKNSFSEDSDIDLLLIVNKRIRTEEAEKQADSQAGIKVKSIQIEISEIEKELKLKEDRVIQSAINTGFPVTNHIEYYKMLYDERI